MPRLFSRFWGFLRQPTLAASCLSHRILCSHLIVVQVKEISFVFYMPSLETVITLKSSTAEGGKNAIVVVSPSLVFLLRLIRFTSLDLQDEIRNQLQCEGLRRGDALLRINGSSVFGAGVGGNIYMLDAGLL
jgi:hypothetical protein